ILLALGQYEYIINLVKNPLENILPLALFGLGGILGFFLIANIISKLFKKHKNQTILILTGLMIGAILNPLQTAMQGFNNYSALTLFAGLLLVYLIYK